MRRRALETPFADGGAPLALDAGEQVLAVTEGADSLLRALPPAAFENLLVVSTATHPTQLEREIRGLDYDPSRVGTVPVTGSSVEYDGPLWVADRASPADLTGISMRISEAVRHVRPGEGWICFDSVSTLYMYADAERVYRFVDDLVDTARESEARGVYRVVEGTLSTEVTESLRSLVDDEIRIG